MSQTLQRSVTILELVAERPRRIVELAQVLGVHHSTALRLVHTLRDNKLLFENPDHSYRLGSGLFSLASRGLEQIDLRDITRPHMQRLGEHTGETVHLGILEGTDVVYIDKVEPRQPVQMYSKVGQVAPLHCTAVAKAILAHTEGTILESLIKSCTFKAHTVNTITTESTLRAELATIRNRGLAFDREEHEYGIHCIAAPLLNAEGDASAAISITAVTQRVGTQRLEGFAPMLLAATIESSRELGWRRAEVGGERA